MPRSSGYRRESAVGSTEHADAYEHVTAKIIEALESGTVPWHEPWRSGGWPASMSTGRPYRGINVMLLGFTGYPSKWWGTYRQISELGGQVRKSEKSQLVTFWKELQTEDTDQADPDMGQPATRRIPVLRTFRVFNYCQADGLPEKYAPNTTQIEPVSDAETMIGMYLGTGQAARLVHDVHGQAYYQPSADVIHLPPASEHTSAGRYYSTLFHELTHSTGHSSRLNRPGVTDRGATFGCELYGKEELCAEMGAAFLSAECGAESAATVEASGAYLRSWLEAIRADKRLVVQAASQAQKAVDLIIEPSRQPAAEPELEPGRDYQTDLAIMRRAMERTAGRMPEPEAAA